MGAYTVVVTREDDLWVAFAKTAEGNRVGVLDFDDFADLHVTMPEFITDMIGDENVDVTWRYEVNGRDVTVQVRRFLVLTDQLRRTQREQEQARAEALAALTDAGLSQRVMADVVQLSHQRVNQLVHAEPKVA